MNNEKLNYVINLQLDLYIAKLINQTGVDWLHWNKEYEICAGKKNKFPKHSVTMVRKLRTKKKMKKLREKAMKSLLFLSNDILYTLLTVGLAKGYQPTKYWYKAERLGKRSLKISEDYEYDWFLGGVDSCKVSRISVHRS